MKYKLQEYVDWCEVNDFLSSVRMYKGQEQYIEFVKNGGIIWYRDDEIILDQYNNSYPEVDLYKQLYQFRDYKIQQQRQDILNNLLK